MLIFSLPCIIIIMQTLVSGCLQHYGSTNPAGGVRGCWDMLLQVNEKIKRTGVNV